MNTENTLKKPQYITTTLPYVNARLHMGHALEFVRTDVLARYYMLMGHDVFFNTGTDEHGIKILEKSVEAEIPVQEFVDNNVAEFRSSLQMFGISDAVHYIRTTDQGHIAAAQAFWKLVQDNGYIYKKNYTAKYCIGCETEKTDSELVDGLCPEHPDEKYLKHIDEENYFFKYSEFGDRLLALYDSRPDFIVPEFRMNEMRSWVSRGLQDFSISRLATKMPWGIPVPGDDDHVMYVWFDALVNYISTLGWSGPLSSPGEGRGEVSNFEKFWINGNPIQYCGKDNTRFQSAMWQAMLMAAGLPNSHQIIVNGFITADGGVKMSKTLGNTTDPADIVEQFGTDALRTFLIKNIASFEDSPFTLERFADAYHADLANGIGNLVSRTMNMVVSYDVDISNITIPAFADVAAGYASYFESRELNRAAEYIWNKISDLDKFIADTKPFTMVKTDPDRAHADLQYVVKHLAEVAVLLQPIIPTTSEAIINLIIHKQKPISPLFMRKD
jgi:methionyl-tRNA synthetase